MKFVAICTTMTTLLVNTRAFAPVSNPAFSSIQSLSTGIAKAHSYYYSTVVRTFSSTAHHMVESDFASAMPVKPEMSLQEKLVQRAREFADTIQSSLGDGVDPPPELFALEEAVKKDDGADTQTLAIRIYELMIEQGMIYDKDPDTGILTPTGFDIPANLDVPEVQTEFKYLYTYGMSLIAGGMIPMDTVKEIVKERLISRTGLNPEEFDAWLGF